MLFNMQGKGSDLTSIDSISSLRNHETNQMSEGI